MPHAWPEHPKIPGEMADGAEAASARRRWRMRGSAVLGGAALAVIVALVAVNSRATDPEQLY